MPNKAAKIVSESLLGIDFKTVLIGGKGYTIYPPTIKTICQGIAHWAKLAELKNQNKIGVISQIPDNNEHILRGLSYFIIGDVRWHRWKANLLYYKLRYGTPGINPNEMNEAVRTVFDLIQAQDFFDCATLCANAAKMVAAPR